MKPRRAALNLDPGGKFPGEIAGASLKRASRPGGPGGEGQFPGEIAGASLKQRRLPRHPGPLDHNSPAKSPGPH